MADNDSQQKHVSFTPAQLAVTAARYPKLLGTRNLKPDHIAAILIDTRHFTPAFPINDICGRTIVDHTKNLMCRAFVFGKYYTSLTPELQAETNHADHFRALGWSINEKITLEEFDECVRIWSFVRLLDIGGENRQMSVLNYGWKAYGQVKESVLRDLGLLNGVGEEGAKKGKNADGVQ